MLHPALRKVIRDLFYGFSQKDIEEIPRRHYVGSATQAMETERSEFDLS